MHVSDSSFFPQRVDEPLDVAGEDPSPATEDFDLRQLASKGKPTFKTQPNVLHFFYIFKYHVLTIMYLLFLYYYIRVGITVVVLGQRSTYLIPFPGFRVRTTSVDMIIAMSLLPFNVYLFVSRHCWIEAAPTNLTHTLMRDWLPR